MSSASPALHPLDPQSAGAPTDTAVHLRDVRRVFSGREVLGGIDPTLPPGEFVALLGHFGTGQTTHLRILSGLDREEAGTLPVPSTRSSVFNRPSRRSATIAPISSKSKGVAIRLRLRTGAFS